MTFSSIDSIGIHFVKTAHFPWRRSKHEHKKENNKIPNTISSTSKVNLKAVRGGGEYDDGLRVRTTHSFAVHFGPWRQRKRTNWYWTWVYSMCFSNLFKCPPCLGRTFARYITSSSLLNLIYAASNQRRNKSTGFNKFIFLRISFSRDSFFFAFFFKDVTAHLNGCHVSNTSDNEAD